MKKHRLKIIARLVITFVVVVTSFTVDDLAILTTVISTLAIYQNISQFRLARKND